MSYNPMQKSTPNGFSPYELVSGLQKFIRRSMEEEALYCFYELEAAGLYNVASNRLCITVYEDCGLNNPELLNSIPNHIAQMNKWHKSKNGAWRLVLGNIILQACRGKKTRLADHFVSAMAFKRVNGYVLDLDKHDFVFDKHTRKGKQMGRGRDHFFTEGIKIIESTNTNDYLQDELDNIDSAYADGNAWELYREDNRPKQTSLFDE
jgi:replication-associated recombination protein RarA